ncbi:DUF456 family protein [Peptococcaceae bacterium]|nr:DUF456 family protein [Peptococcaceae bacterium]
MELNILLQGIALLIILIGIVGHILPIIPGTIVTLIGMLMLVHVTNTYAYFSLLDICVIIGISILIGIVDVLTSILGTKAAGGSNKAVVVGSTAACIGGAVKGWLGLMIGAVLGTLGTELKEGKDLKQAIKATIGNVAGFFVGSIVKIVLAVIKVIWFLTKVY